MRTIALSCVAVLVACAHAQPAEEAPVKPVAVAQPASPPPVPAPVVEAAPQIAQPVAAKPFVTEVAAKLYFDFDKADLTDESRTALQAIAEKPAANVRIEGNCDERGTSEYNLALGQRRADAAKKYLVSLGISAANITTISYGKERPKALGHDEESWRENRRDDVFVQPAAVSEISR